VDGEDNILVTGKTGFNSRVRGGYDATMDGLYDAFVMKFSPTGARIWSTYLGGAAKDWGNSIDVDAAGNILVGGGTTSQTWISGGFDTTFNGGGIYGTDSFVAKIRNSGGQSEMRILSLQVETGHTKMVVETTGFAPSTFIVESTGTLNPPIPWIVESDAVITGAAAGRFLVQLPLRGEARFYRVRALP